MKSNMNVPLSFTHQIEIEFPQDPNREELKWRNAIKQAIQEMNNQFSNLPHSDNHSKKTRIVYTGDFYDINKTLDIRIEEPCCFTYEMEIQNHFNKIKEKGLF